MNVNAENMLIDKTATKSGVIRTLAADNLKIEEEIREREPISKMKIGYIAGTIKTEDISGFFRLMFRMTRGKIITHQNSFDKEAMKSIFDKNDPDSTKNLSTFLIILPFHQNEANVPRKLNQICSTYGAKVMQIPTSFEGFMLQIDKLEKAYKDFTNLKEQINEDLILKLCTLADINKVIYI